jgi:hypothetical protein
VEAQAAILKILEDNSGEEKRLDWLKQISVSSIFFPIADFPAVLVEDSEPAFETFNDNNQNSITSEKQNLTVSVIIASANTNEANFDTEDYMTIKTGLKSKANAVKELLLEKLPGVSCISGGSIGPASINDIAIESVPAMILTMPVSVNIII